MTTFRRSLGFPEIAAEKLAKSRAQSSLISSRVLAQRPIIASLINFCLRSRMAYIPASRVCSIPYRMISTSAKVLPCRRIRPERCSTSEGRNGQSKSCSTARRSWIFTPVPSFIVEPITTRTSPEFTRSYKSDFCLSVL